MNILVPEQAYCSDDKQVLIAAVEDFINQMLASLYRPEEIPAEAFECYCVNFYESEMKSGGAAVFLVNSNWSPDVVGYIRTGLTKMRAPQHLALFEQLVESVEEQIGKMEDFLEDQSCFQMSEVRTALRTCDEEFSRVAEIENLTDLNHEFLQSLSLVQGLPPEAYEDQMQALVEDVPNRDKRVAAQQQETEPVGEDAIRKVCDAAGQELMGFNSIEYGEYEGRMVHQWHVTTCAGLHYIVIAGGKSLLFDAQTGRLVAECEA